MNRTASRAATVVLVVLLVASPVVGSISALGTAAGTPGSAPDGFTVLPDTNVQEDVPVGKNASLRARDLQGSVMTNRNASSLEVVVTTPRRAEEYVNGSSVSGAGGLAIVFQDDRNHEGRKVALPASDVRRALGYEPEVAHGVHEDGTKWAAQIEKRNGLLIFKVPRFSSNSVTFDGKAEIHANPAVNGSRYSYELGVPDTISDFVINVTGSTSSAWDNETATAVGDGGTMSLEIAGNVDPTGPGGAPEIVFTGRETTYSETSSGTNVQSGDTVTISVSGDEARDATVTFTGSSSTSSASANATAVSSGSTKTVDVGGDAAPTSESVTFTGETVTGSTYTASGSGDGTISVNGNVDPTNTQVTFIGVESTNAASSTGTWSLPSDSSSISVGGNLDPTSDQVTLTGNYRDEKKTFREEPPYEVSLGATGNVGEVCYTVENAWSDPRSYTVKAEINGSWTTLTLDNHLPGDATETNCHTVNQDSADQNVTVRFEYGSDSVQSNVRATMAQVKSNNPQGVSVSADTGDSATVGNIAPGASKTVSLDIKQSTTSVSVSADSGKSADYTIEWTERTGTEDPSVDVDGDGTADASYTGILASGQTATKSLSSLSNGSVTVDTSTAVGPLPDWDITYDERIATEDPALDVDGDGTAEASYSGILKEGETATVSSVDWSTGSRTVEATTTAGKVTWQMDWTETHGTEDPSVDIDGDGAAEGSYTGVLLEGETATVSVSEWSTGDKTVEFGGSGKQYDYQFDWTRAEYTEDPAVDLDGDGTPEASYNGVLSPGETATKDLSELTYTTSSLTAQTASGTTVDLEVQLKERAETQNPKVIVNGNETGGSTVGQLSDGETASLATDTSWIEDGTNNVTVEVGTDLSADAPTPEVQMEYSHSAEVLVETTYTAGTWHEDYNVSHTYAGDREDATVRIPFSSTIYKIEYVEYQINGNGWQTLPESSWTLKDGTKLVANVDDTDSDPSFEGGDELEIRTAGYKVSAVNGEIKIVDPTGPDAANLQSGIKVLNRSAGFHIQVGGAPTSDRVHYTTSESWSSPEERAVIGSGGAQDLYLPNAPEGGTATVTTIPVEALPEDGDVGIHVTDTDPITLQIDPGETGSGSAVTYRYYGGEAGVVYGLKSVDLGRYVDKAEAGAKYAALEDDDSSELLVIKEPDEDGSTSSGGGGGSDTSTWEDPEPGIQLQEVAVVGSWTALVLLLVLASGRSSLTGRRRWLTVGGVSAGAGLLSIELLRPGSIAGALSGGLRELIPLAGLAVVGFLAYSLYSWWEERKTEAATPDQVISVEGSYKEGGD